MSNSINYTKWPLLLLCVLWNQNTGDGPGICVGLSLWGGGKSCHSHSLPATLHPHQHSHWDNPAQKKPRSVHQHPWKHPSKLPAGACSQPWMIPQFPEGRDQVGATKQRAESALKKQELPLLKGEHWKGEFILLFCNTDLSKTVPFHRRCTLGLLNLFSPDCLTLNLDTPSAQTYHVLLGLPVNQADLPCWGLVVLNVLLYLHVLRVCHEEGVSCICCLLQLVQL